NLSEGTPREIINDPTVREAYLASTFRGDEFDEGPPGKRSRAIAPKAAGGTGRKRP
ncbi:MAG: ABC transporter ATP-binding protein C-terminal domain-containing protein, partial [Planctomycetota bacterium]